MRSQAVIVVRGQTAVSKPCTMTPSEAGLPAKVMIVVNLIIIPGGSSILPSCRGWGA